MAKDKELFGKAKPLNEILSEDFIAGLKWGLELARAIIKRQGYDFYIPGLSELKIKEKVKKK